MKVNKNIFICVLLAIMVLMCTGAISAADSLDDNLAGNATSEEVVSVEADTNDETVGVEENTGDEIVGAEEAEDTLGEGNTIIVDSGGSGTYTTISAAVSAASSGDTIYIKNGEYTEDAITFTNSLNIVGQSQDGVIIKKSTGNTELFISTSNIDLTFSDLSITDSSKTGGTGLLRFGSGNVNWFNCTFDNLKSKYGAMQYSTAGTVNIEDCTFSNIAANAGSATGAIYISSGATVTINNCLFDNCGNEYSSGQMYGLIYQAARTGSLTVNATTFTNTFGATNSIIRTQTALTVKNSRIINNTIQCRSGTIAGESIIYASGMGNVVVEQCLIADNVCPKNLVYGNDPISFTMNYNNIYGNDIAGDFSYSYTSNKDFNYNYWGEEGKPSNIPESLSEITIVKNGDDYKLSNGEELTVIIPGINDGEQVDPNTTYVSPEGSDDNNGSKDAPVKTIAKAVELASAKNGEILIAEGVYTENNIVLNSNVVYNIKGKGDVVINGNASSNSIFIMHGGQATFTNIRFTNNKPRYGGAIFINEGSGTSRTTVDINVTVDKCTFEDIDADSRGGAIYAWYTAGNLIIKDSTFKNIHADSYGAVSVGFSAYENGLNVEISNSVFDGNTANNGAAAYLQAKTVTIKDSTFANNTASSGPGAIYLYNGSAIIDNCKIYNNSAKIGGAAIHSTMPSSAPATTVTITNSIIENNYGTDSTLPAIYVDMNKLDISYSALINDLSVETRTASSYDGVYGQGIAVVNNNWWGTNDPSSKVKGKEITMDNWVIMNVVANATEVVIYDNVKISVDFNHVNTTSGEIQELTGGVIPVDSYDVNFAVNNGTITPETINVLKGSAGSVIYEVADPKEIVTVTYKDVVEELDFSAGVDPYFGVIYLSEDGDDNNNGSEMAPVKTLAKAISLALNKHGSGEIIISEGTYAGTGFKITRNLTVTGQGKVTLDGENQATSLFTIESGAGVGTLNFNNLIITNIARGYGAFIYNYGASEVVLDNITFVGNTNTNVRFITTNTGSLTIKNSVMSNNTLGGIICHSGSGNLTIINSKFENNIANKDSSVYAGVVYFSSGSGELIIEDSVFKNNTVRQNVVYAYSGTDVYMNNTEISNTKSDVGYGAAIRAYAKLIVDNSAFLNNTAYRDGGAIYIESNGDATITNSVFIGNSAGSSSKGDIIGNKGKLTINYCVLINDDTHKTIYNAGSYSVNAQYNWWGTNDDPKSLNAVDSYYDWDEYEYVDCEYPDVSNWIVMNVTTDMDGNTIKVGDNVAITVDFTKYMDSTGALKDLTKQLPEFTLAATSNIGELSANEVTVKDGMANIVYTATVDGQDTVNIISGMTVPITINVYIPGAIYVSATGNDENDGSSEDNAVASIAKAIELAEAGKIIILNGTYTIDSTLKVNKDLDISGRGNVVINGAETRILENTANLNLTNIAFTNAKSSMGSAILDDGNMIITNCSFYSNKATSTSGGNIINNRKGTMTVDNCKFYENVASRGAIASQSATSLLVNNSEFFSNDMTSLSTTYAMIYSSSADTVVENTIFKNNRAKSGTGIYATRATSATTGTLQVINCTFDNNTANQGQGGAIFAGRTPTIIKDSIFTNNNAVSGSYAKGQGGAIYQTIDDTKSTMDIDNCIFINNTAEDTGAAFYVNTNQGKFDISNSIILNKNNDTTPALDKKEGSSTVITNENNYWGENSTSGVDEDSEIKMDVTVTPEGAKAGDELTITATFTSDLPEGTEVTFTSTSNNLNEKVLVKDKKASITYTLDAKDKQIVISIDGVELVSLRFNIPEVIYVLPGASDNNEGTLENPVGTIAKALELAVYGNIVLLEGTHKVDDLGTISNDLNITGEGKVKIDAQNNNRILYVGEDANVVIKNVIMVNGYTADASGALLANNNVLTLINCTLANSSAGSNNGGAIYNVGKLTIINSTISNNKAKEGGAIFTNDALAKGASIIIENTIFENNVATGNENFGGGAIFTQQIAEFTITNATFKNNKAQTKSSGGAIFISHSTANIQITDSEFISNSAAGQTDVGGGAIYMAGTSNYERKGTLTISNTLFDSNTAGYDGGAIYVRATTLNIANSVLINNKDQNGYAIFGYGTEQINPSITANDNWWGTNDKPTSSVGGYRFTPNVARWAVMTITNSSEIKEGETVTLTVSINNYTTGSENGTLAKPITVSIPVTIKTSSGDIEGVLKNGEFTTDYVVPAGLKYISATVNDETDVLFVIQTETSVEISDVVAKKGQNVEFTVTVSSNDGTVINQGNVELYIGDELVATIAVANGKATKKVMITQDEGIYDLVAKYVDDSLLFTQSQANATLNVSGINNVVTQENFFEFFDESGALLNEVPFDELIFKGEFKDLGISTIYLYKSVSIAGEDAVLNDIGFTVMADNIKLSDIKLNINEVDLSESEGAAILVYGASDVVLDNIKINYTTPEDTTAYGVYILESYGVNLTNSEITFDSNNKGGAHTYAVHIRDSEDVLVKGNLINATLPSLDVDFSYYGSIDSDLVLAVGIQEGDNIQLIENNIYSNVKSASGMYATLDTIMMYGSKNLLISHNNITETDFTGEGIPGYSNVVDLYAFKNATIEYNNIYVKTTTGVEGAGSAYPIQLTGDYSGLLIDHNNLTAIAGGPALGIYSQNYYGVTDITVTNNFINVTGLATGNYYALVSGMELQDTVAKVYNNTIYSYNIGDGTDGIFGISYAQSTSGRHTYDIQNNTVYTDGAYAIYFLSAVDSTVTGNTLYGDELTGDDSVKINGGSGNTVKDNYPPFPAEITIDAGNIFVGNDNLITVTVNNATGSVTIKLNGKTYQEDLNNGVATKVISKDDLINGINFIEVTYNGDDSYKVSTANSTFKVLDGVITNETYSDYFVEGTLVDIVPVGATLDFQGLFLGKYTVNINKPVNVISSTGDALFDSESKSGNTIYSFNVVAGGDHTNITGIALKNYCLYIRGASYVTVDDVNMVANVRGVGSGTGFLAIHTGAYYTTVKNSYFENGGTGSSVLVLGKGGAYVVFDHNIFNITGSTGNIISANQHVGAGDNPEHTTYTNNLIYNSQPASIFAYAMTVSGSGNLIENNTIYHNGNGILNQYGADSVGNVYRNNTLYGSATFSPSANSLVENNHIYSTGTVTISANTNAKGNEFKAVTISGANVNFTNNIVNGVLTVNSNGNTITANNVTSTAAYAITIKNSQTGNTVTENRLVSASAEGNDAVSASSSNIVENNYRLNSNLKVVVDDITFGQTAVINISLSNVATGNVQVIVDGKKQELPIKNGSVSIELHDLAIGVYTVGVSYEGDDNVMAGENQTSFTVSKIKSDAIITTTELNVGEEVNVTVTIPGATGSVTIVVDNERKDIELVDGIATFTIDAITAGEHSATVIYLGDGNHAFATNTTRFTVDKISTEIKVDSVVVNYGEPVEFDIVVGPVENGELLVTIGDSKQIVKFENGIAHISLSGLKVGTYDVIVKYEGSDIYDASENNTASITVNAFDSGLSANSTNIKVGEDAVINVEINKDATGNVVVKLGNETYTVVFTDGKAIVTIPNLADGTYTAVVTFDGDDKFLPDEVNTTFTVSKSEIPANGTNVSMDIPEGTTSPTFTIKLPSDATGNFTVTVDGKDYTVPLVNGSASITVENLTVGDHNISTSYTGDNKYDGFATANATVNIPKASIPGGEDALNLTSPQGSDSPTYSIKLPSDATGNLTVTVDGKDVYSAPLVNGSASVTVPGLSQGDHNIVVSYTGDTKYSSISKTTTFHVPVIKLSKNTNIKMLYTAKKPYKVLVTKDGKAVKGVFVSIKFNGKTYKVKTNAKGYATLKLPNVKPKKAKYTITASYAGKTVKNTVKVNTILKVGNKKIKKSKKVTKVKFALKKVNGKFLKGKTLKLKFKGKTYKAKTNKKGVATFKLQKKVFKKLKVGKKYSFKVTYAKDVATKKFTIKK